MFDDLINLITTPESNKIQFEVISQDLLTDYQSNLYWCFTVKNIPGVLVLITGMFSDLKINIEKIIQKEEVQQGIEIVLLTSNAKAIIISEIKQKLEKDHIFCSSVIPFV